MSDPAPAPGPGESGQPAGTRPPGTVAADRAWAIGFVGVLGPVTVATGAMGLVLTSGLAAVAGLWRAIRGPRAVSAWLTGPGTRGVVAAGLALTVWGLASSAWSPLGWTETATSMAPQLAATLLAVWALGIGGSGEGHRLATRATVALGIGAGALMLVEVFTGYGMVRAANPAQQVLELERTLGRAALAVMAVSWLSCLAMVRLGFQRTPVLLALLGFALLSTRFGMDLNLILFALASLAVAMAWLMPRVTIGALFASAGVLVATAPLAYPLLADAIFRIWPNQTGPLSYERRGQMWRYAVERITEKPLAGWGLDASRTFDGRLTYRGYEWAQIQLHPHSAPLQIWLELGLVGAGLTGLLLLASGWAAIRAFGHDRLAAAALVSGLTVVFVSWSFSFGLWQQWLWAHLTLVVACTLALRRSPA